MKAYSVVARCEYRDYSSSYVCATFNRKADAMRYMRERCYITPSRTYTIECK